MRKSWARTAALGMAALGAAVVAALPAGAALPPPSPIVNGSFETGDLTGWTTALGTAGSTAAVAGVGFPDGSFAGEIVATAALSQTIPRLGGGLGSANKLRGWARFLDAELGSCVFNDTGQVFVQRIVGGGVASSTLVFSASSCATSTTPWTQWTYNVPGQGAYRIVAIADNGSDDLISSVLQIDAHTYQGLSITGP